MLGLTLTLKLTQLALADELARLGRVGALVVQLLLGGVRRVPLIGTKGAAARAAAAAPRRGGEEVPIVPGEHGARGLGLGIGF